MDKFIEFIGNHPLMVSAWLVTLGMVIWIERQRAGKSVSPAAATQMVNKENAILVDVRVKKEWESGHIAGAKHIPLAELEKRADELNKYRQRPVIIVCNLGQSAGAAVKLLKKEGFDNVVRMAGGMTEWKGQNLPVVK